MFSSCNDNFISKTVYWTYPPRGPIIYSSEESWEMMKGSQLQKWHDWRCIVQIRNTWCSIGKTKGTYVVFSTKIVISAGLFHCMMTSSNGSIFRVTGPLCGNSPVTGEFPAQRPVTRSFDVFFDLRLNKRLSKQSCDWWFETPSRPLWRHSNGYVTIDIAIKAAVLLARHMRRLWEFVFNYIAIQWI